MEGLALLGDAVGLDLPLLVAGPGALALVLERHAVVPGAMITAAKWNLYWPGIGGGAVTAVYASPTPGLA